MIFVTVGTTMAFDELLQEVDRLAGAGAIAGALVCQVGQSRYRMSHGEQFIGRPSIDDLIADSAMVITHGGATVIQLLIARKAFVAFANPRGAGDHQTSFLANVAALSNISWSRNVNDLGRLLTERAALGPARIPTGIPRAGDIVRGVIADRA